MSYIDVYEQLGHRDSFEEYFARHVPHVIILDTSSLCASRYCLNALSTIKEKVMSLLSARSSNCAIILDFILILFVDFILLLLTRNF